MDRATADSELRAYRQRHDALLDAIDRQSEQSPVLPGRERGMLLRSRSILERVRVAVKEGDLPCLLMWTFCAVWNAIQHDVTWRTMNYGYTIRASVTEAWLAEMVRRYGRDLWQVDGLTEDEGLRQTAMWDVLEDYVQLTNQLLTIAEITVAVDTQGQSVERKGAG